MSDEGDVAAGLDAHHADDLAVRLQTPERHAFADLPRQFLERHVRLVPAVDRDYAFVSLGRVIDDREERRQIFGDAGSDRGRAHVRTIAWRSRRSARWRMERKQSSDFDP